MVHLHPGDQQVLPPGGTAKQLCWSPSCKLRSRIEHAICSKDGNNRHRRKTEQCSSMIRLRSNGHIALHGRGTCVCLFLLPDVQQVPQQQHGISLLPAQELLGLPEAIPYVCGTLPVFSDYELPSHCSCTGKGDIAEQYLQRHYKRHFSRIH